MAEASSETDEATSETDEAMSENERVAFVHERIRGALYDGLDDQWEAVLAKWEEATPGQRRIVAKHVAGVRNRVWGHLSEIQAVDELETALAIQYVELKARWTTLNTQIQSQTATGGDPDRELVYRASCVSLIIQALEPLLRKEQVEALTDRLNRSVGVEENDQL
jgi:hypothetical protein